MLDSVDTPAVESQQPIEVQKDAERLGWIPPSRFKGDPARFVDADIYIKRGEEVLPIVKEQNKRLHNELDSLKRESQATAQALKAAQDAIAQMEERHTVATQKAVEDARRQVKAQLAAASEAGDHEGVAELTEQLTKMRKTLGSALTSVRLRWPSRSPKSSASKARRPLVVPSTTRSSPKSTRN